MPELQIERLCGADIEPLIPELARLRTEVFREYPYLYDGTPEYEEEYLATYVNAPEGLCVVARVGEEVVGASTGLPLDDADAAFRRPFIDAEISPSDVFYFGESVLMKAYRGRGIGHRFFDAREHHARELGRFSVAAFCAVERDPDDPRRPPDYRPLDAFWQKRGFERRPDLRTTFDWKELGEPVAKKNTMVFWLKRLDTAPHGPER